MSLRVRVEDLVLGGDGTRTLAVLGEGAAADVCVGEGLPGANGLDSGPGLLPVTCEEGVSGVQFQGSRGWMGYLGPSAALHCRASLGAYRWEGRRP